MRTASLEFLLRDIAPADVDALTHFFTENNRPEITAVFHPVPLNRESAEKIARHTGRDRYFAVFRGHEIVGLGMLRGWDEGFATPSFGVLVDHRERGQGLGRQLTEYALAVGGSRVRLSVYPANTIALALYRQLGFGTTETLADGRLIMLWERSKE